MMMHFFQHRIPQHVVQENHKQAAHKGVSLQSMTQRQEHTTTSRIKSSSCVKKLIDFVNKTVFIKTIGGDPSAKPHV